MSLPPWLPCELTFECLFFVTTIISGSFCKKRFLMLAPPPTQPLIDLSGEWGCVNLLEAAYFLF